MQAAGQNYNMQADHVVPINSTPAPPGTLGAAVSRRDVDEAKAERAKASARLEAATAALAEFTTARRAAGDEYDGKAYNIAWTRHPYRRPYRADFCPWRCVFPLSPNSRRGVGGFGSSLSARHRHNRAGFCAPIHWPFFLISICRAAGFRSVICIIVDNVAMLASRIPFV